MTSEAKNYAKLFLAMYVHFFFPQRLSVTCNFRAWLYDRIPDVTNLKSIYLIITSLFDPRFHRELMYEREIFRQERERKGNTSIANNCHLSGQGSLNDSRACDCHDSLGKKYKVSEINIKAQGKQGVRPYAANTKFRNVASVCKHCR